MGNIDFFQRLDYMEVRRGDNGYDYNDWSQIPVSVVQAWYYYTHQNDPWLIKLLVSCLRFPVNIFWIDRCTSRWVLLWYSTPPIKSSSPTSVSRWPRVLSSAWVTLFYKYIRIPLRIGVTQRPCSCSCGEFSSSWWGRRQIKAYPTSVNRSLVVRPHTHR